MKIKLSKNEIKIFFIVGVLTIVIIPLILTNFYSGISFMNTGQIGDTIGGITAPFLSLFGAILVYLAFIAQIDANEEIKSQFANQKLDDNRNFIYEKFKERIYLVNNEADSFEVSFHEGKLISKLEDLHNQKSDKYKFSGVQGLNLFLIEYFRDKKEKESTGSKDFNFDDAFHAVMISIMNLVTLFYNTHLGVKNTTVLDEEYKLELEDLLTYTFQSKLNFIVELYYRNYPTANTKETNPNKFLDQILELRKDYFNPKQS